MLKYRLKQFNECLLHWLQMIVSLGVEPVFISLFLLKKKTWLYTGHQYCKLLIRNKSTDFTWESNCLSTVLLAMMLTIPHWLSGRMHDKQ